MARLGFMATHPGRYDTLGSAIASIAPQLDHLFVCCNDYREKPGQDEARLSFVIPERDYKDVGKFHFAAEPDDIVVLLDDDILYPVDYVARMEAKLAAYRAIDAIVGLHGVTYPDLYDGAVSARSVNVFTRALDEDMFVNQLGTGTVCCFGRQMPSLDYMDGSQRYVDVRFAVHAARHHRPMVCVARPGDWLQELAMGDEASIFAEFTGSWPLPVVREVQEIAGYARLPSLQAAARYLEKIQG